MSTWSYQWDDSSVVHMGPMAEDFAAAFGLGDDEQRIFYLDAIGVLCVALKELTDKVHELEKR